MNVPTRKKEMPAKGMVVGSSPTKSVGFPTDLVTVNELSDCNQLINYLRKGKLCSHMSEVAYPSLR